MAIERKLAVALPPGKGHRGIIMAAEETETDFGTGVKEATARITVQPEYADKDGTRALPLSFNVSPTLTGKPGAGLSALARLYDRLGLSWDDELSEMEGLEIVFDATAKANGFLNIEKDSIRLAPKKAK